jgi:hypothetical protein
LKDEEGTVEIDSYRVWCRRVGSGAVPLLLLGGPNAGCGYFADFLARAEAGLAP